MKKQKKLTKKQIKKNERISKRKALQAWSLAVRQRDNNTCQICGIKDKEITKNGKPAILNAHHILAKESVYSFLMFDVLNGLTLCQNHHRFSRKISAHRQEFAFFLWFMNNKPEQFEYLKTKLIVDQKD